MGHFGRWNMQQWDALGPLLHGWKDRRAPALPGMRARKNGPVDLARPHPRATARPGGEADLTWNACIQLNKGVWLGCHGGALTLFHPEVRARLLQSCQAIIVHLATLFVEQEAIA